MKTITFMILFWIPLMGISGLEGGPYLIYDCQEKHWECVAEISFEQCLHKRQEDFFSESYFHRCAPLGPFPTKKSCFQRQLFLTSQNYGTRFCLKDVWKAKAVEF
jgi:hypothetical protein